MFDVHSLLLVGIMAAITFLLRVVPFIVFPADKKTPQAVAYLSQALPCAIMGMLVVYCLKDVSLFQDNHGIPEAAGILAVVLLHKWKHNALLSIAAGTMAYMFLVQVVF